MRAFFGRTLPLLGVLGSVVLLLGAVAIQLTGGDATRVFGLGVLCWMGGIGSGLWLNGPRTSGV